MLRKLVPVVVMTCLVGCQTTDPYTGESKVNNASRDAAIGAVAGAVLGAAVGHNNRGKGAMIGAAVGGLAGGGYGYYRDKQEEKLRQQLAGSGVDVQRSGENIKLIMPGNITFRTGSADIQPDFYQTLNTVSNSLREFPDSNVRITGHTDSTGDAMRNQILSEQRANSVARYLEGQGVSYARLQTSGLGARYPIDSNATEYGRQANRRVELDVIPLNNAGGNQQQGQGGYSSSPGYR
ncbi:MAG: OmpA family protein [Pseudomonadales bacterium]|nr:OmpA family protein [Pseudomonadales bacterium]